MIFDGMYRTQIRHANKHANHSGLLAGLFRIDAVTTNQKANHSSRTMKFPFAAVVVAALSTLACALSADPNRHATSKKLLMKAARRRLNETDANEEYEFLVNYKLKLIRCKAGERYISPENGELEWSSVVFRLCPSDSCDDDDGSEGCSSGYGDFIVGLNTFVESFLEAKRDEMQEDDGFMPEQFGQCREYYAWYDDDTGENTYYSVGPACSEDGTDIVLDFFADETCTTKPDDGVTFWDISDGLSLPYSSGGLVSTDCESCASVNDHGEFQVTGMCARLYENSGKCETYMESFSGNGPQVESCEYIAEYMAPRESTAGTKILPLLLIAASVVVGGVFVTCGAYLACKMKKTKAKDQDTEEHNTVEHTVSSHSTSS